MNIKFFEKIIWIGLRNIKSYLYHRKYFGVINQGRLQPRKKLRLDDLVYKDIPTPMCKCEDCKMVRHPVIQGYRLPRVKRYYRKPY